MKIFPIKPLSNYDRMHNIINIIENSKHLQGISKVNLETPKLQVKEDTLGTIFNKYRDKITNLVTGTKKNNGKKSTCL